ncbi:MAG TPA: hypothetical protein VF410_04040, partial [Rhizomicrobium sp.]
MIFPPAESAFLKAELNVDFFESVSHTSPDIVGDCTRRHMSCRQRGFSPVVSLHLSRPRRNLSSALYEGRDRGWGDRDGLSSGSASSTRYSA